MWVKPDSDWILEQARQLSSRKDENSVRALAWNLSVAFARWEADCAARAGELAYFLQTTGEAPS